MKFDATMPYGYLRINFAKVERWCIPNKSFGMVHLQRKWWGGASPIKVVGWCISNESGGVVHLQQKWWGDASPTKLEGWCISNKSGGVVHL